jgi:hypothetical protein
MSASNEVMLKYMELLGALHDEAIQESELNDFLDSLAITSSILHYKYKKPVVKLTLDQSFLH